VNYKSTVRFGMSQSSSCAVPLTVSGLEAYCGGATSSGSVDDYMDIIATTTTGVADAVHPDSPTVPLPVQLTDGLLYATATDGLTLDAKTTLIAGWADASYLNVADWKACSSSDETDCATVVTGLTAPTLAMAYDSDTRTCSNVPIGINIDILTAKVGTMDNPQSRVSRVELSWEYGSWTYADPYAASSTRQDFMLKSTVRFVEMDQASAEGVTPATPPIFPAPRGCVFPIPQRCARGWARGGVRGLVGGAGCRVCCGGRNLASRTSLSAQLGGSFSTNDRTNRVVCSDAVFNLKSRIHGRQSPRLMTGGSVTAAWRVVFQGCVKTFPKSLLLSSSFSSITPRYKHADIVAVEKNLVEPVGLALTLGGHLAAQQEE
jgi:hypothetical protein